MNRKERLEHYRRMLEVANNASFFKPSGFCFISSVCTPINKVIIIEDDLPELLKYKPKNFDNIRITVRRGSYWFCRRNIWKRRRILKKIISRMEKDAKK